MSVFITYLSYNKYLKRTLASSCCTIGLCGPGRADLISSGLPLQAELASGCKDPVFLNSGRRWANTEPLSGLASPVGPWRWAGRVPGLWVPLDGSQGILPVGWYSLEPPQHSPVLGVQEDYNPEMRSEPKPWSGEAVPGAVPTPVDGPEPGPLASLPPWAAVPWMVGPRPSQGPRGHQALVSPFGTFSPSCKITSCHKE